MLFLTAAILLSAVRDAQCKTSESPWPQGRLAAETVEEDPRAAFGQLCS